jgi:heterodisulfide reductase subunit A-like polyferredoxin/coenzyme F420-reducing hydrogenase delta subunit
MKLGAFLCTCDKTSSINFKDVKKSIKVEIFEIRDRLCQDEGLSYILDGIRRKGLNTALVGCALKKDFFKTYLSKWGIKEDSQFFLDLREHCGWVHDKREATQKAKSMVRAMVGRIKDVPASRILTKSTGENILVVGSSKRAVDIAKNLSKFGDVRLLSEDSVRDVKGSIGNFSVEYLPDPIDQEKCILCGRCVKACPEGVIRFNSRYSIGECSKCGDCVEICPTNAIDLYRGTAKIDVGHIVVDSEWTHTKKRGIYVLDNFSIINAVSDLHEVKVQKHLELDLENCASGKSGIEGCKLCEEICPHDAIAREGNKVVFDEFSCTGCGLCAAICPTSLPKLRELPNETFFSQTQLLLDNNLKPKVLMFVCAHAVATLDAAGRKHLHYPAVMPFFLPNLGAVSEAHLLRAFDLGADGIVMLGCGECIDAVQKSQSVEFTNLALQAFNLGNRIRVIKALEDPESFVETLSEFVQGLSPIKKEAPSSLKKADKRGAILTILSRFSQRFGTPDLIKETTFPFVKLFINSNCTLCEACSNMCPTNAIKKEENKLKFVYPYCIACTLCEKSCPERAIEAKRILDFKELLNFEEETLLESELVKCKGCGKGFISKRAQQTILSAIGKDTVQAELLNYCEECKPAQAMKAMMGKEEK